ncbi:MAG: flagellar biosynthesis protein FliQ [Spirochaetes bacterium]|nr:flagellar biosynthesis protein FliQ [Spirochaetota bacterium]
MTMGNFLDVMRVSLYNLLIISAPILLASMLVGLIISILQATTQIQEQTLTFVPKLVAVFAILIFMGPWILKKLMDYTIYIFNLLPQMIK